MLSLSNERACAGIPPEMLQFAIQQTARDLDLVIFNNTEPIAQRPLGQLFSRYAIPAHMNPLCFAVDRTQGDS